MKLRVEEEALNDVESAYLFFANRSFEYADYFRSCLREDLKSLVIANGFHPIKFGYHYAFSKKFRTTIYYSIDNDLLQVVAILDQRFSVTRTRETLKIRQK